MTPPPHLGSVLDAPTAKVVGGGVSDPSALPAGRETARERTGSGSRRAGSAAVRAVAVLVARFYLRRPDLADAIAIRYRSLRAIVGGIRNEIAYRLGWTTAPALLSVNLELTNRCNLRCTFCPTADGRMSRAKGFMDPALFRRALDGAGRLEFALLFQWGEPLLHPKFFDLAKDARSRGVRTLVTTNGTLLDERRIAGLLDAGIDRVTVSVDGDAKTHEAVRGVPLADTLDAVRRLRAARDASGSSTAVDVSMVVAPETEVAAEAFDRAFRGEADRVQRIPLLTRGVRRSRCREPWRGGLVVLQDGRTTVCCADHDGELAVGDAKTETLASIWNGPRLKALREAHATGDLPPICAGCTEYPTDAAAPRFGGAGPRSGEAAPRPRAAAPGPVRDGGPTS